MVRHLPDPTMAGATVRVELLNQATVDCEYADWTVRLPETSDVEILGVLGIHPTEEEAATWPSPEMREYAQKVLQEAFRKGLYDY